MNCTVSANRTNYLSLPSPVCWLEITQLNKKIFLTEEKAANFFIKDQRINIFQLCRPRGLYHNYSFLLL